MSFRNQLFSEMLALPKDSPRHRILREELWLLGDWHACRYYVSILTRADLFAMEEEEFLEAIRGYVLSRVGKKAAVFCTFDCCGLEPFLRQQLAEFEGRPPVRPLTRQDRAVILLVKHPDWGDSRIARELPTTEKQLQRWTNFQCARRQQRQVRHSNPA